MFKKFTKEESVSSINLVKSSVQRSIRTAISEQYPSLQSILEDIIPKKTPMHIAKCQLKDFGGYINIVLINNQPLFFQISEGPYYPHLRLLHKYPFILPHMQTDKGAIKHVIVSGANIMCPGLTTAGAKLDDVPDKAVVAIHAEGKEHAMAVGLTELSTVDIRKINKGPGITNVHHLNDGLWKIQTFD